MDGLSDSDLETLLKNFNELSAEEQHSLIAYLKKLEAREPARVERLRQYVSDAAGAGPDMPPPRSALPPHPAPPPHSALPPHSTLPPRLALSPHSGPPRAEPAPVLLESDDDDYTVEEVCVLFVPIVSASQVQW